MTEAHARLYLAAARDDPLVAAWIRILDEHRLPARAEVAPSDFQGSFDDLFLLDLIPAQLFNAIDFKHRLAELIPSAHDIDRALSRLADLRADHPKEHYVMDDKFGKFTDSKALTLRGAESRRSLLRAEPFSPLTMPDAPAPFAMLARSERESAAFDLLEPSPRSGVLARNDLAATRRALEPRTGLPCQRFDADEDEATPGDPRTFVRDFDLQVLCCGKPVVLEYENGEEVGQVEGSDAILVEFLFYGECPQCGGRKTINETRPLPPEVWR